LLDAHARQLSVRIIEDYQNGFRHFCEYVGDPPIADVTVDRIRHFLAHLGEKTVTLEGVAKRPERKLSKKSILNIHVALSALWTWASTEGFVEKHIIQAVKPPKPEEPVIEPFSKEDVEALLEACEYSRSYTRPGKKECRNRRPTAERDRAIILTLLDTGIRSGELAEDPRRDTPGLLIRNLDQRNRTLKVFGKGDKERVVCVSHKTLKAIWRYLLTRPDAFENSSLFASSR
jgi:integrase/recombinase XerD